MTSATCRDGSATGHEPPTDHEPAAASFVADEVQSLRRELDQRKQQLETRPVIEQAKGMLMQDFTILPEEAFQLLVSLSQQTNTKVRVVAERVVALLVGAVCVQTARRSCEMIDDLRRDLARH